MKKFFLYLKRIIFAVLFIVLLWAIFNFSLVIYGFGQLKGQLHIVMNARSLKEVLNDSAVPDSVKQKIAFIELVKKYAIDSLELKPSQNYTTFYDQENKPSSQAGLRGNMDGSIAHYCVAKAGIVEYTRLLAGELGPFHIHVNCIAPGLVLTSRANKQFNRNSPENIASASARIPLRRVGIPEDCAKVVEFLATDLSDYVTGQVICIDGGMVLSPS